MLKEFMATCCGLTTTSILLTSGLAQSFLTWIGISSITIIGLPLTLPLALVSGILLGVGVYCTLFALEKYLEPVDSEASRIIEHDSISDDNERKIKSNDIAQTKDYVRECTKTNRSATDEKHTEYLSNNNNKKNVTSSENLRNISENIKKFKEKCFENRQITLEKYTKYLLDLTDLNENIKNANFTTLVDKQCRLNVIKNKIESLQKRLENQQEKITEFTDTTIHKEKINKLLYTQLKICFKEKKREIATLLIEELKICFEENEEKIAELLIKEFNDILYHKSQHLPLHKYSTKIDELDELILGILVIPTFYAANKLDTLNLLFEEKPDIQNQIDKISAKIQNLIQDVNPLDSYYSTSVTGD